MGEGWGKGWRMEMWVGAGWDVCLHVVESWVMLTVLVMVTVKDGVGVWTAQGMVRNRH
jgi:hypothetical protein